MDQHHSERYLLRFAAVLIAVSILLLAVANAKISSPIHRMVLTVTAAIPFLFGIFFIYLVILSKRASKREHNYFLYDRTIKGNISPSQLTATQVADRTVSYMALFRKGRQLYIRALFESDGGAPEAFKPLFCYQLLKIMSTCKEPKQWSAFLEGGKELADIFSAYLTQEDEDLNRHVQFYMAQEHCNAEDFRAYLESQNTYLSDRMLTYTKEHLHEFD